MPRKHTRANRRRLGFHHVFNRTWDRGLLFIDAADKRMFLEILDRYLAEGRRRDARGKPYARLYGSVRLVAFALMSNHFHLILFQIVPGGIEALMKRVIVSYTRYFHARHGGDGPLFAGEYRAVHKPDRRAQLTAISYVHDNHGDDCRCEFCGNRYYCGDLADIPSWLDAARGLQAFGGADAYRRFRAARRSLRDVTADSQR